MRKKYVFLVVLAVFCWQLVPSSVFAQEEGGSEGPVSVSFGAQIKSRHLWNGGMSYDSWNMQPDFTVSVYGFYFNAWGLMPAMDIGEVDLTLGYDWKFLSFSFTDMYYPGESESRYKNNKFFGFPKEELDDTHQGWVSLAFTGVEKFPIGISAGAFVYGNRDLDIETGEMKELYSMYLALSYSHTLKTGQTLQYELGMTPFKGFFAEKANVVNVRCKVIQPIQVTSSFAFDVSGELVFNPEVDTLYFVLGIGI